MVYPYVFWAIAMIVAPMLMLVLYAFTVKGNSVLTFQFTIDNFIRFFNQDTSVFAVNQKNALEQMKSVEISATAALEQDGYIVSPIAGARILEETSIVALISLLPVSAAYTITFFELHNCDITASPTSIFFNIFFF